jgi:hypothetical protein
VKTKSWKYKEETTKNHINKQKNPGTRALTKTPKKSYNQRERKKKRKKKNSTSSLENESTKAQKHRTYKIK